MKNPGPSPHKKLLTYYLIGIFLQDTLVYYSMACLQFTHIGTTIIYIFKTFVTKSPNELQTPANSMKITAIKRFYWLNSNC